MPRVDDRISPTETMMDGDIQRYLSVGVSAMNAIKAVVGRGFVPSSILDIPCGHGRVARHLAAEYPGASLFVSDLDEQGAAFCGKTFGATVLKSAPNFDEVNFDRRFDLIWVGSLITHLPDEATAAFLRFVSRHLSAAGVAVVTSHGSFVAGRLFGRDKALYGLTVSEEHGILNDYFAKGYGYCVYPAQSGYGISLISRLWLHSKSKDAGLKLFAYHDHAWDNHQDVIGLRLD